MRVAKRVCPTLSVGCLQKSLLGYIPGTPDYKEKEDMYDEIIELKKVWRGLGASGVVGRAAGGGFCAPACG